MSLTDLEYLGDVLLKNLEGTFSSDELQEFIDREGDVKLAQAAAYEVEASKVAFNFKAGDVSADKLAYYKHLTGMAKQIREDALTYATEVSSAVSWSGSADFGTAEAVEWIDEENQEPSL